jgi:FtsP/CotA-like multicopper oxidase with cupredoxin domain
MLARESVQYEIRDWRVNPKLRMEAKMKKRKPPWKAILFGGVSLMFLTALSAGSALAQQTPLAGSELDQFQDPLPVLDASGAGNHTIQTVLAGTSQMVVNMKEFRANMLPHTFVPEGGGPYDGTWVWGYVMDGTDTTGIRETYTGPVVVATRGIPSEFKFVNDLGDAMNTNVLAYKESIDQSLHWANPFSVARYISFSGESDPSGLEWVGNPNHYEGPIPAAVHLHGAEDPAAIDGGPESWFTSDGQHGKAFYSKDGNTNGNYTIYRYPNVQEAAPLWFHDHTLGATRLNVYAGLAGGYLLIDPNLTLPTGLNATGLRSGALGPNPADDTLIPLVVQDRSFDTEGQLYFPAQGINPEHQYWIPEFFGDTVAVNGKVWPFLEVKAQRYRFLLIDGSNARTYELTFQGNSAGNPVIWQIGTDQGYLDSPVPVDPLVVMPGERAEFIIDFSGLHPGDELVLYNWGPDEPFDGEVGSQDPAESATTGRVMKFKVVAGAAAMDTSFNPAAKNARIRSSTQTIVRLVNPKNGKLASKVMPDLTRELTLVEIAREDAITVDGVEYEGGPLEVLVNNTKWFGLRPDESNPNVMMSPPLTPVNGGAPDGIGNWLTEMPKEGTTEVWEIVNTTADAHPIHTHLAQFQLLNRQSYDTEGFDAAYAAAFLGGEFIPAYGPPLAYGPSVASGGKYGGNPDVKPFLNGTIMPPNPNEAGWKDTVLAPPGQVTRFVVRWAPTDINVISSSSSQLSYAFLPNDFIPGTPSATFDYVWHCHIVDHEDNEMMRPDAVVPRPHVKRSFVMGTDY